MAREEEEKQKGGGPGLGDLARLARAGGGSRAVTGVALRAGAAALPVIAPYLAVIAAVFVIIIIIVIIIGVVFNFGFSGSRFGIVYGEEEEEEKILSVAKTATPYKIEKNAPPTEVTYKITAENVSANVTLKDVKVSDGFLGLDKSIGDLGPGNTHTETVKHTISDTSEDKIVTNTVTVTGTIPGAPPSGNGLNYYIPYADTSIVPVSPEGIKAHANSRYPDNNIDKPCPGGVTCWDYVIAQSKAHKISPAFAIAIWWEEGGFGGLVNGGRSSAQFGCGYHPDDFHGAFDCFLHFTSIEHPYDPDDPYNSFYEWVNYFCGTEREFLCGPAIDNPDDTNEGFIDRLASIYNDDVAPGNIVYMSGGQNQSLGETVTVTATATVIIGSPPQGPPAYAPLKGPVSAEGGWTFNPPIHEGLDIHTGNSDWSVYSPFAGIATVTTVADDGDCAANCYGVYIDLRSGEWSVRMAHLVRGAVSVKVGQVVNTNEVLGVMDETGSTSGVHIHYEIKKAEELVDPAKHNALKGHP